MGVEAVKVWKASGGRLWDGMVVLSWAVECALFAVISGSVRGR